MEEHPTSTTNMVQWQVNATIAISPSDMSIETPVGLHPSVCIAKVEIECRHISEPEGKNYISSTFTHDYLMIDSGAQACVCSPEYYPNIAVAPLLPEHTPQLRTVTGASMKCHGVKVR